MAKCEAMQPEDSGWHFCPSIAAAYAFAAIFIITTVVHFIQGIYHRKVYSWVVTFSAGLQALAYIFRVMSIKKPEERDPYVWQFVTIMVAPVWTNAYVYMVMGRMVYNFTRTARVFKFKAWSFGLFFVILDIIAFLVQIAGALIASGKDKDRDKILMGIHIYMGGVAIQQLFIFLFLVLAIRFHQHVHAQSPSPRKSKALLLLGVQYAAILMITIRIIFRLVEFHDGLDSDIPNKEVYQYTLDSVPMAIALYLYNIFNPGRLMPGRESDLPGWRERRQLKKQGIVPSGRADEAAIPALHRDVEDQSHSGFGYEMGHKPYRSPMPNPSQGQYTRMPSPASGTYPDPPGYDGRSYDTGYDHRTAYNGTTAPR